MKKSLILLFALFLQLSAFAGLRSGHFFKSLQRENLTEQQAVECFNQWFTLPQETEWRRVGERTDRLGMTRVEYRQYVGGVEVEHSQVLLHVVDGMVKTANGTVMEAQTAPRRLRSNTILYRNGTPTDVLGRKLYLVSTYGDHRYATKVLSADKSEWIYTDVETAEVLKRIPTRHGIMAEPVKVAGSTIYSGEVEMDASFDTESGTYMLCDPQRNIHTMIGATIPSLEQMEAEHTLVENFPELAPTLPVPEDEMTPEMWEEWNRKPNIDVNTLSLTNYIARNALYARSTEPYFDSYIFNTLTIDRLAFTDEDGTLTEIVPSKYSPLTIFITIQYAGTDGMIERGEIEVKQFPFTFDLKKYFDEIPTAGADIYLYGVTKPNPQAPSERDFLTTIRLVPDGSGHAEWDTEQVKASATYEKGPWSASDIHWGMQNTYDYFLNTFGRNSYDDKGAPIFNLFYEPVDDASSIYFLSTPTNNAAAVPFGTSQMVYGMGSRDGGLGSMYPVVELSVLAHEFTHMVTHVTADLVYQGEAGALNESFSDVLGISVKKHVLGNDASWTIADGVMVNFSNLRSMSFPKTGMDSWSCGPDTYKGSYWKDTESEADYGGVHTNSGVQNKWYYLLTDGDSGTNDNGYNYTVTGIGLEKSQQIAYRTLTEYATQESQYADIRLCSIQAAEDLYGANSAEAKAVDDAWKAVGVVEDTPTAIHDIAAAGSADGMDTSAVYDLQGRRVESSLTNVKATSSMTKLKKGLYIVNGRKVLLP